MPIMDLRRAAGALALGVALSAPSLPAGAQDAADLKSEIEALRALMEQSQQAYQQQIEKLESRINELETQAAATPPPPVPAQITQPPPGDPYGDLLTVRSGNASARFGLNIDTAFGTSTAPSRILKSGEAGLQGGGHDPNVNGFTLQAAELSVLGEVDPYFDGFANMLFLINNEGETVVELEEAWAQTRNLPWGLQVRAGQYYTDFGRANKRHVHQQAFVDQPFVITRLLGGDGQRAPGAQLSWLSPLPWYSEFIVGAQNCMGETMSSFCGEAEGVGEFPNTTGSPQDLSDRIVWSGRWLNATDLNDNLSVNLGVSGVTGRNRTGPMNDTWIAGADLYAKWQPAYTQRGFPFVSWETEVLYREYDAGDRTIGADSTLTDWGLYTQGLWGFRPGWVAGLRFEYGDGGGDSAEGPNSADFRRAERRRLSPNITWYPTEFSKIRLQYNYDWAENLPGAGVTDASNGTGSFDRHHAHSVWLQLGIALGEHAAHRF